MNEYGFFGEKGPEDEKTGEKNFYGSDNGGGNGAGNESSGYSQNGFYGDVRYSGENFAMRRNKSALKLSVVSLILACLGGLGIFLAIPALVRATSLSKETKSETVRWAKTIALISVMLNLVVFIVSVVYFAGHYQPIELPSDSSGSSSDFSGSATENGAALISFLLGSL